VPPGALAVSADGRRIVLQMRDVAMVDQPRWPAHDTSTYPARISFRAEWIATDEPAAYEDQTRQFRVKGWRAAARLEAEVDVPALDFSWRSDPLESSSASFGVIGEEVNGRYFQA
jgi:hypothetical protein